MFRVLPKNSKTRVTEAPGFSAQNIKTNSLSLSLLRSRARHQQQQQQQQ